jgi:hypothetical protein
MSNSAGVDFMGLRSTPAPAWFRFVRRALPLAIATFILGMANPRGALCQNEQGQRNDCAARQAVKTIKTVSGTYTEEATIKNVE